MPITREVEAKSDGKSDTLSAIRKWERTWLMPWIIKFKCSEDVSPPGLLMTQLQQNLSWFIFVVMKAPQLRFERHPSVHKLFLKMQSEQNHSTSFGQPSFYQFFKPLKSAHPTLVSVCACTPESLSYLSCGWEMTMLLTLTRHPQMPITRRGRVKVTGIVT